MSTTYAGDPTNYPTSITVPSDGDDPDAASVNAALEGLADRTAALNAKVSAYSHNFDNDVGTIFSTSSVSPTWESAESSGVYVDIPDCKIGDVLFVAFT